MIDSESMKSGTKITVDNEEEASTSVGHLEEEARKRKARLASLKRKLDPNEGSDSVNTIPSLPKPVFRSYNPSDETLKELKIPTLIPETVEEQVSDLLESSQKEILEEIDLANLAPRKIDWDLKRNIQKKLDKLERRTQRSIAVLIRERMKSSVAEEKNE